MATDAGRNTIGSDQFQRLRHQIPIALFRDAVADGAMHVTSRSALVNGCLDSLQNVPAAAIPANVRCFSPRVATVYCVCPPNLVEVPANLLLHRGLS